MLTNEFVQFLAESAVLHKVDLHHVHITEVVEVVVLVPYVCDTTRHTCSEITSSLSEHNHTTTGHIFAAVVAGTLDDSDSTRVAHSESLAHLTVDVELTACCSIKTSVTGYDIVLGGKVTASGR